MTCQYPQKANNGAGFRGFLILKISLYYQVKLGARSDAPRADVFVRARDAARPAALAPHGPSGRGSPVARRLSVTKTP